MKTLSVCIPTYEMNGQGADFLKFSFDRLASQSFKDFDVVVSDHSKNDAIQNLCLQYKGQLDIHYHHNTKKVGSSSANINNAMRLATGRLIKILFQDDFLYDDQSLATIIKNFDLDKDHWLVTASQHSTDGIHFSRAHYPEYTTDIYTGHNLIGSPSALTIKNDNPPLFDEKLIWLMDCEYYKRCYDTYGSAKIIRDITVVNRIGSHQVSNTKANQSVKKKEIRYIVRKYRMGIRHWLRGIIGY